MQPCSSRSPPSSGRLINVSATTSEVVSSVAEPVASVVFFVVQHANSIDATANDNITFFIMFQQMILVRRIGVSQVVPSR